MSELIDIFREEVDANLKEATRLVLELEQADTQEPERALTEALMRVFHTLTGAARAIGFEQEKQIAHRLEDVYHDLLDGKTSYRSELPDLSLYAIDLFHDTVDARQTQSDLPELQHLEQQVDDYCAGRAPGRESPVTAPKTEAASADEAQPGPPQPEYPPVSATPTKTPQQTQPDPTPAPALLPDGLDLLGIFTAQVQGHLVQAGALLEDGIPDAADAARNDTLRRTFHTIKGAARAIGFIEIRDAAAAIEELFRDLVDRPTDAPAQAGEALTTLACCALDCIETILARHIAGDATPSIEPLRDQVARYRRGEPLVDCAATGMTATRPPDAAAPEASLPETPEPETRSAATPDKAAPSAPAADQQPPPTPDATTQQQSTPSIPGLGSEPAIRATGTRQPARHTPGAAHVGGGQERANIAYEQLDRLHRLSGELTVSVSALSGQRRQMRTLALELSQAQHQLNRIGALAQTDGLARETLQESLRGIIERLGRAGTECATLTDVHDRMESRLRHISDDLVHEVTQARLAPLSELLDAFPMS